MHEIFRKKKNVNMYRRYNISFQEIREMVQPFCFTYEKYK